MKRTPSAPPSKSSTSPPPSSVPVPPESSATKPSDLQDVEVIFVGMHLPDGKPCSLWLTRPQYDHLKSAWGNNLQLFHLRQAASMFPDKAAARRLPGNLYTSKGTQESDPQVNDLPKLSTAVVAKFRWCGAVIDTLPHWKESRFHIEQIVIAARQDKLHAEKLKHDDLADMLKPIRKMYMGTDRTGRAALEVTVLRAIREG